MTKRSMFPGGNTPEGFISYFPWLAGPQRKRTVILKGGPGVGKSSLMRWIATELEARGEEMELFCCASDAESLDGINAPGLGFAMLDGTSPHVVDPELPGARDSIENLGLFLNEAILRSRREAIEELTLASKRPFRLATLQLQAAAAYDEEARSYYRDFGVLDAIAEKRLRQRLMLEIFGDLSKFSAEQKGMPLQRHLFLSAIAPQGVVHDLDSLARRVARVYRLKGALGLDGAVLLEAIAAMALEQGIACELYHSPLRPSRLEHLYLPSLDVAILSENSLLQLVDDRGVSLDLLELTRPQFLRPWGSELEKARLLHDAALRRAVDFIRLAKKNHDLLEAEYLPAMDFNALDERKRELLAEILQLREI